MSSEARRLNIDLAGMHPQDMLPLAQEAEEAGFYSISVGDNVDDSYVALAGIASVTQRVKLVSNIATWTRTPVATARACRSLASLSGGRYIFGLGSMPRAWNEDFHGIPGEAPLSRMREYVELLRLLWAATPDAPVEYEGRFYRVSGYRVHQPPPYARLPIYIGASRGRMLRETGEWADGVLFNWNYTLPWIKDAAMPALSEGATRVGRSLDDLELVVGRWVFIVNTPEQAETARAAFRNGVALVYLNVDYHQELLITHGFGEEVAAARAALARGDFEGAVGSISDRMVDTFAIIGTADECLERAAEYTSMANCFTVSTLGGEMSRPEAVNAVRQLIRTFGN